MKKSEMVCKNCIKFDGKRTKCRLNPLPVEPEELYGLGPHGNKIIKYPWPDYHWCAQGEWHKNKGDWFYGPTFWGDWEVNEKGEPL